MARLSIVLSIVAAVVAAVTTTSATNICSSAPVLEFLSLYSLSSIPSFSCPIVTPCVFTLTSPATFAVTTASALSTLFAATSTATLTTTSTVTITTATLTATSTAISTVTNIITSINTATSTLATTTIYANLGQKKRGLVARSTEADVFITITQTNTKTVCPTAILTCSPSNTSTTTPSFAYPTTTSYPRTIVPTSLTSILCSCLGLNPQTCGTYTTTIVSTATSSIIAIVNAPETTTVSVTTIATVSTGITTTTTIQATATTTRTTATTTTTTVQPTATCPASCQGGQQKSCGPNGGGCQFIQVCGQIVSSLKIDGSTRALTVGSFGECQHQCDQDVDCGVFSYDDSGVCTIYDNADSPVGVSGPAGSGYGTYAADTC